MEKIDIVYILGKDSKWNDNELKYSLRSIEKHLMNYRNIYVIGECPSFLTNIIHIPLLDFGTPCQNILKKLEFACNELVIGENFIAFQDDYFLTKDIDATVYPNYCLESLYKETIKVGWNNWYKEYLRNTYDYIKDNLNYSFNKTKDFEPFFYDIHYPIIYNKQKFLKTFNNFSLDKFVIKTLYGTINGICPKFIDKDCKITGEHTLNEFKNFINNTNGIFSTGDKCLTKEVKEYFKILYPNKSIYEK